MRSPVRFNSKFEIRNFQSNLKNLKLKILLFCLFSLLYSLFSIQSVSAQSYNQTYNQKPANQNQYITSNTNSDVTNNLHNYTQTIMLEVASGLSCLITGVDPANPNGKCLGFDTKTGKIGYVESGGGAVGAMGNMIAMLYTPPAHTGDYVVNLAQNFGITKSTFARQITFDCRDSASNCQSPKNNNGVGFQGLSPLIKIWETFRNIVYLLFVLVFIVIGVAVMLRVKIDPRTVMTIQNQIPKLIIGIILVTFSFAIAGFLIDLMWVVIYLLYGVFASISTQIPGFDIYSLNPQAIQGTSPIGAIGGLGGINNIANNGMGSIQSVISSLFDNTTGSVIAGILGGIVGTAGCSLFLGPFALGCGIVTGIIGGAIGGSILGLLGGVIAYVIITAALLWALFRIWFTLLMAYIMILIDVVFAPFWILAGLVPGSKLSFSTWIRDMLGNLAAFPAVFIMFLLGKTFMNVFATPAAMSNGQFVPPLIGNPGDVKSFGALIGIGIILSTPGAVKMMKAAFSAPQIDLSALGQSVSAGAGAPGRLISGGTSAAFSPHYKKNATTGQMELTYPGGGLGRFLRGFGVVR